MIKVVWLCHFANAEMKTFFDTPHVQEMAQWINTLIILFRESSDIELHIVTPNIFTNKQQEFKIKNVQYHFYQHRESFIPRQVYNLLRIESRTNYYYAKQKIVKIIKNINPDIIHLHGTECPYYTAGILPLIELYPVLVTIQGFLRNASERNFRINKSIKIEKEILKRTMHIGVRTKEMSKTVLELNPEAHLHFHNYPIIKPVFIKDNSIVSTYDIVFFARVCKDKGMEDLLEAVAVVKKEKPDISLHVIGSSSKYYLQYLKNMTKQLDIETNVKFLSFMESQQDVYKHAIHARICVLPTYHDIIPGTIIESMFMKLPVIAYAVGGIPELNDKGQAIVLVEKNNIKQLANEILALLKDDSKRYALAKNAYTYARERFNNSNAVNDIMKAYNEILSI